MDIPNDSTEQIYHWVLNSLSPDLPIKQLMYYYSSSRFLFRPPGKSSAAAVKEAKLPREAKIKYNMTQIKVTTRPIKNSSENVEISTISEIEEFIESTKEYELERQEFVGEPYYTEFQEEEEREYAKESIRLAQEAVDRCTRPIRLAQEVAMFSRSQETIRQQLAMFSRSQESINLALNSSLRSVQQTANIRTDFLRDVRRAANIKADFLRDVRRAANIKF